jgi:hypothetical protein
MDFSVDPRSLRSGGRSIEGTHAGARVDLRRSHGETASGARSAWGNDLGAGAAYDELSTLTAEALDLITTALARSGAGTQRMADAYEHVDSAARDGFHSIDVGRSA